MSWYYKNQLVEQLPENIVGFVYEITNNISGKKYIGKKLAFFSKTTYRVVTLKNGTKKRKRIRSQVPSDWPTYWGSNQELQEDIKNLGESNFSREILFYCYSKSECSYIELREQILRQVLESDNYYNGIIQVKIHKNHIKSLRPS